MSFYKEIVTIKQEYGKKWLKLFYHDSSTSLFFHEENELIFTNTKRKFSIFGMIDNRFRINDYFEFLLQYPSIPNEYNNWRQKILPNNASERLDTDIGYNADDLHISWNGTFWGGLIKSSTDVTLIDGSVHLDHWWFSIGATEPRSDDSIYFYGPSTSYGHGSVVTEVYLWIRIPDNIYHQFLIRTCKNTQYSHFLPFFFITILS